MTTEVLKDAGPNSPQLRQLEAEGRALMALQINP